MSMLADALKFLADLKQQALTPHEIEDVDPRERVFFVGGVRQTVKVALPVREHRVFCLSDIIRFGDRFKDAQPSTAWVHDQCVKLVLNDDDYRDELVVFPLNESGPWRLVKSWNVLPGTKAKAYNQDEFVRLLRVDLAGTHDPTVLLNRVRRMTWTRVETSERQTTRESMGRSIEAQAGTGPEGVPEEITLTLPVYDNPGERATYTVRCAVEVLADERQFRLTPLPGEVARVQELASQSIINRLIAGLPESIPTYFGTP